MKYNIYRITLITILFITTLPSQAQNATTLLNEVSNKVKSYDNIAITFKYILTNTKENIKQETRGNITMQGEKYILNMMGMTRIFNGSSIYTIVPEDEEVTISTYNKSEDIGISVSELLTFYEHGYTNKMDVLQTIKGRKIQYIKLTPIDTNAEIKDILLGIDMQTKHIYKLIQTDSSGTNYTVSISAFKTNQIISETLFYFDENKYKEEGYYINKLD